MLTYITRNYIGKFCTRCDTVCHLYEQGLACDCASPWETERINEEDYPDYWEDCDITVKYQLNGNLTRKLAGLSQQERLLMNRAIYEEEARMLTEE